MTIETRPAEVVSAPKVKTTADVLRHAAWIIEERGWCQNAYESGSRLCVIGAINTAYSGRHDTWGKRDSLSIKALSGLVGAGISTWNDAPGRTAAEVTAALRAAADASERAS